MNRKSTRLIRPVRNPERGQSLVLMAGLLIGLLGMAALVIDLGNVYFSYRQLQAATDAAALAGAEDLPNTTAAATAISYGSAGSSTKNYNGTQSVMKNVTMLTPQFLCVSSTGVPCLPPADVNTIQVTETATVNTFFAKLFGVNSVNIKAIATGSAKNGNFGPFNVLMVIDNTPSMSQVDSGCTLPAPNNTKIGCALAGLRTLTQTLSPCSPTLANCGASFQPVDEIGLSVFPPLQNNSGNLGTDTDCNSGTTPQFANYAASGSTYQVIPFSTDYKNGDNQSLNTASNLSMSIGGGSAGCAPLSVEPGSQGISTFYSDAIQQGQIALVAAQQAANRANSTNVLILLSDGDANQTNPGGRGAQQLIPPAKATDECKHAIAQAAAAKAAGTWVYSIAYGASTKTTGSGASCATDKPPTGTSAISACSAMQQIASDSTKFFSDTVTSGSDPGCVSAARPITDLNQIFAAIAGDFTSARLIPNSKFQ